MCALALALPLLPGPATAHQLTSVKQVSNTGQTDGTYQIFTQDWAQAFTTGSHADGYTLTSLVLSLFVQHSSALNQSYSVTIHAANSSGRPGVKLGTLTNPTLSVSTSFQLKTFTAAAGIVLDPDTTYFVVVDVSGSGSNNLRIRPTSSNNEDSGKAAGWSIANNRLFRTSTSTGAWSSNTNALKVAIHGHENKSHWRYMNNPPVFTGTPYEWVNAVPGGLSSLNISESDFSDPDGHALTYSISWSRDDTAEPGFIVWNTDIGRLFFRAKSSCDLAALTPRPSRTFDTVATITATDPYGETVVGATRAYRTSWSCATSGNSDPYVSTQIPDQSAAVAAPYTYTIPANTFFDSQFDTLDYTATRTDGSALPAWLKFDAATRTFSGTPGESDIGTVAVKVAVNDGHWTDDGHGNRIYGTASDTFTMEVSSLAHLPAPTLSAATLSARTLVAQLAFEGQPLNPRHCPEPGAWTFKVDGVGYNPYSVACRTDSVTLRLADSVVPPIRNHHKVTLSYDRHRAGGHGIDGSLRSVYGASVVNFSDRAVTLTEAADVRRPTATGATVDGRNLTLFFSEPLNAGSAPAGSAFTVSGGRTGTGTASIDGATVRVTLDSAVSEGETLTVRYTRPSANPLRDRAGLRASPFRRAANNITGPPGFLRAAVNGKTLVVTFDEPLDAGAAPAGSAFRVTATPSGGTSRTIAGTGTASIDGAKVTLTLASAVAYGDTVTVRYTRPSANPLRDLVGDRVASFSGQAVTNNTAAQAAPQGGLWSGSLTLQNLSGVGVVGQRLGCSVMPDCASGLTSDSFTHNGETYRIREFVFARSDPEGAWDVYVTLDKAWPQRLRHEGSLYVGATQLSLAGASYTVGGTRVGWSGTAVRDIVRGGTASLGLTLPFEGAQANNVAASSVDSGASVSDVAVVSDPGADDTYGDEDEIRIRVTFDAAVDVDTAGGKPRLKIKMDPNYGEKWAAYKSGSGTTMLEFAYTVEN
ncbi:MAG: SwmB domain-containing protein, partial [Rhodospirillaceae bacterium]|nr:SwmB domain-containing protein [Rhodospirillaceae bacterium]